ncbi:hypothetical protein [Protaetiibacter mangrovi]|uniref:Uncharacterized protein n=1 Tax=Protaetiibacter mangrovi TaxID=2970926 RepID=A0ABT1ZFH9_9MICO|nr:hypothetical protein [Protaetiibacter mangrovi]MCS0499444.1 hypothetical protein [Protaetiibacter mangrovi]
MKRTGIFALAAGCAIGVTALVGGVGYASALDVAEQAGQTLDVSGVSTVDPSSKQLAESTTLDDSTTEPTAEPTDDPTPDDSATDDATSDEGTADQGSGDAVDEVDPSDPVVIKDDGDKNCRSDNAGERVKRVADREAWLAAQKAAEEAAAGDDSDPDSSGKDWSDKDDDGWDHDGWNHDGDRGGDWGSRDGDRSGSWGGGHHGGGGWGGGHH